MINQIEKESIITEYLTTETSYRELGKKRGVDFRTLHQWVQQYQGKMRNRKREKKTSEPSVALSTELPTDVKQLQEELRKARLMNEILTEVINVAEEELKIPIRKKFGTK